MKKQEANSSNFCQKHLKGIILFKNTTLPKFHIVVYFSALILCGSSQPLLALTNDQKLLSKCQAVYAYAAHLAQIQNNPGLATNLLFRSSRSTTALFMTSAKNGKVKGSDIDKFKKIQAASKNALDANQAKINDEILSCDQNALPVTNSIESRKRQLWGKSFQELQRDFLVNAKQTIGL